jgi:hypothetical protein
VAEVQDALMKRYPEAFSQFGSDNWRLFWKEIFGITDYKIQFTGEDEWMQKQKDKQDAKLDRKIQMDRQKVSSTVEKVREEIGN